MSRLQMVVFVGASGTPALTLAHAPGFAGARVACVSVLLLAH